MTRIFAPVFIIFFTLFSIHSLFAQSEPGNYQKATYYHVDRENLDSFMNKVEEWKGAHQNQINNSDRLAWRLYRVPFSSSASAWYNFVTIEISSNLNSLQTPERNKIISLREGNDHHIKLSYAVHSEIWTTAAEVYGEVTPPSRYINANFMYAIPHTIDEYLELEIDIAKPLHQHQTDNNRMDGILTGWFSRRVPWWITISSQQIFTTIWNRLKWALPVRSS